MLIAPLRRSPRRSGATAGRRYGASATPSPGVPYRPNLVPIGGGAKSVRSVSGDGLTWTNGRGRRCPAPVTLFVRDVRGAHPPVVLLHEGAGSGAALDRFLPRLLAGHAGLLYHRRGYRCSPRDALVGADHFSQARTCSICSTGGAPVRHTCWATATAGRSRCSGARQRADRPLGCAAGGKTDEKISTPNGGTVCGWRRLVDHAV
jgi:pimeloyl-ACP methyl ester carboxylesterase